MWKLLVFTVVLGIYIEVCTIKNGDNQEKVIYVGIKDDKTANKENTVAKPFKRIGQKISFHDVTEEYRRLINRPAITCCQCPSKVLVVTNLRMFPTSKQL